MLINENKFYAVKFIVSRGMTANNIGDLLEKITNDKKSYSLSDLEIEVIQLIDDRIQSPLFEH